MIEIVFSLKKADSKRVVNKKGIYTFSLHIFEKGLQYDEERGVYI